MLNEIHHARDRARDLLKTLIETRDGRSGEPIRDLYKLVTGASSLENAIEATQRAVDAYERMILELSRHAAPSPGR